MALNTKTVPTTRHARYILNKIGQLQPGPLAVLEQIMDAMNPSGAPPADDAPTTYTEDFVGALESLTGEQVTKWLKANHAPARIRHLHHAYGVLWDALFLMSSGQNDVAQTQLLAEIVPSTIKALATADDNFVIEVHSR